MDIYNDAMTGKNYTQRIKNLIFWLLLITILPFTLNSCGGDNIVTKVVNLRCEYLNEPLGLAVTNPRFTWEYDSHEHGFVQKNYFIEVGSSEELLLRGNPDLWSSGKIKTSHSFAVYRGKPLESYGKYFWHLPGWFGFAIRTSKLWIYNQIYYACADLASLIFNCN
jgi:hypothetical protein